MDNIFKDALPHLSNSQPTEERLIMSTGKDSSTIQSVEPCCQSINGSTPCGMTFDDTPAESEEEVVEKKESDKKRKTTKTCTHCKKAHVSCDGERPCSRCVKRGTTDSCTDAPVKKRSKKEDCKTCPMNPTPILPKVPNLLESLAAFNSFLANTKPSTPTEFPPCGMLQPESLATPVFASNSGGKEFEALAQFSKNVQVAIQDQKTSIEFPSCFGDNCSKCPFNHLERYYLVAASAGDEKLDEKDATVLNSLSDRLAEILKAKASVGLLKPFDYAASYKRMEMHVQNRTSIAQQRIRQALQDVVLDLEPEGLLDLVPWLHDEDENWNLEMYPNYLKSSMALIAEEAFERLLLEYDRTFSVLGVPAALWRRTGEIVRCNREFAALVGIPAEWLREGKVTIQQVMHEDTEVNYWEKWKQVASDGSQKAVITSCVLQRQLIPITSITPPQHLTLSNTRPLPCSFSFTIRRDAWNVPVAVVGNFLPINPPPLLDVLMERLSLWGDEKKDKSMDEYLHI